MKGASSSVDVRCGRRCARVWPWMRDGKIRGIGSPAGHWATRDAGSVYELRAGNRLGWRRIMVGADP